MKIQCLLLFNTTFLTNCMSSFKKFLIEHDLSTFQHFLQSVGVTFEQLLAKLKMNPPDAQGGNAVFYKIPNSEFGIRILKHNTNKGLDSAKLEPANDPLAGHNFGQPIANYGHVQIVRLQHGLPAGVPHKHPDRNVAVNQFRNQIIAAANMPQEQYNALLSKIMLLNQRGYCVDPSKPGNLLIDKNQFNLVDIGPLNTEKYRNTAGEIIVMLMHNYEFGKNFSNDRDMILAAQQIIKKVEAASQATGLPMGQGSSLDYSRALAQMSDS